jgi:hypothetical protein
MKNINKYILTVISLLFLVSCDPEIDDVIDIGSPAAASFTIEPTIHPNKFLLKTTAQGFLFSWDLGDGTKAQGPEVEAHLPFKGEYIITHTVFSKGGHSKSNQNISVTEDDPDLCINEMAMLTGCDSKTWVLAPEAGALYIGPDLNVSWWGNSLSDVVKRVCHFNDEYTFSVDRKFEHDNKGDFWADTEGGVIIPTDLGLDAETCHNVWPEKYSAWGSKDHTFSLSDGKLTINGLGAWMGLYKTGTGGVVTEPQQSTTYNIIEMTDTRMVLLLDYGWGVWRFTFVDKSTLTCEGDFAALTGCGSKTWKLAAEAGALHIGPTATETWWGNGLGDVETRSCHFNDEYIFNTAGQFIHDQKGDFWADTDGNGDLFPSDLAVDKETCNSSDLWPEKYKSWDSGEYTYSLDGDKLTVNGMGAWMGLYKVGTAGEVSEPQESVTFTILELSDERMVIGAVYDWGVWRFTLVSE